MWPTTELIDSHFPHSEKEPIDLVGHSLGGIVCLYGLSGRVRRLVMIDSLGALSRPAEETIPQLRRALQWRVTVQRRLSDVETAAQIREEASAP